LTSEPASVAASATLTGALVYQPAEHAAPSQAIVLAGAVESAVTAKLAAAELRPAPFWAVTSWPEPGCVGEPVCAYVAVAPELERVQPAAAAGNV